MIDSQIFPTGTCIWQLPGDDAALVDALVAQRFLNVSRATIDRLTHDGRLPRVRLGKACRYRAGDLRRLATPGGGA